MQQYLIPNWPAPKNIVAYTTLRDANLEQLSLPTTPVWLNQIHSNIVVKAEQNLNNKPCADAAITTKPNTICAIRTADCLPILICDKNGTEIAAIHAGWRGLAAGIISATCKQFSSAMQDCLVWLGPAIGPSAFEVGLDVLEAFVSCGWSKAHIEQGFVSQPKQKWLGNLYHLAKISLQELGIRADNIYGGEWCTFSDPQRFYSYRRSSSEVGRMVSLIWIK